MNFLKQLAFILACVIFPLIGNAQIGTATLASTESPIVLNTSDDTLYENWQIDISGLGFDSPGDAKYFFDMCMDNLLNFEIKWEEQQVIMKLGLMYQDSWTLEEWAEYIASKME